MSTADRDIYGEVAHGFHDLRELREGATPESEFAEHFSKEFLDRLTEIKAKQFVRNGKLKYRLILAEPYTKPINDKDTLYLKKTVEAVLDPNIELVKATAIKSVSGKHDGFEADLREFEMKRVNPERTKVIVLLEHAFGQTRTDFVIDNQTGKVVKQSRGRISQVLRERGFYRWGTVLKKIEKACRAKKKVVTIR